MASQRTPPSAHILAPQRSHIFFFKGLFALDIAVHNDAKQQTFPSDDSIDLSFTDSLRTAHYGLLTGSVPTAAGSGAGFNTFLDQILTVVPQRAHVRL